MGSKKLAVRSRNLLHGHNTARLLPDSILLVSIQIKEQTAVYLLSCHQDMILSLIMKRCYGITFCQIGNYFFYCLHRLTAFLLITL